MIRGSSSLRKLSIYLVSGIDRSKEISLLATMFIPGKIGKYLLLYLICIFPSFETDTLIICVPKSVSFKCSLFICRSSVLTKRKEEKMQQSWRAQGRSEKRK